MSSAVRAGALVPRGTTGVGTSGPGGTPAAGALVVAALLTISVRARKTGSKRRRNSCSEAKSMVLGVAQVTRLETRKRLSGSSVEGVNNDDFGDSRR